ncbi:MULTISPECIES: ankyrin repeat domain-containing protein [unclassified Wolbachia]|uniref:ankyrin repeat domain-containing protein n=1 Tax=unclassified Wolbachia TaxID=2640676 RepID=UPI002227E1D1|nr:MULTISPECIES: ankyrin repeat domain-containing protein [unclassified Wolbachia]
MSKNNDLMVAAAEGNLSKIIELINQGADVNAKDRGLAPLHFAATYGQLNAVEKLIEEGADVNVKDALNLTPLFYAINYYKDKLNLIEKLIKKGADVNAKSNIRRTYCNCY